MLILLGTSHHSAPVAVRERFAFDEHDLPQALARLRECDGVEECMILSTCNRVELLARSGAGVKALDSLRGFLAAEHSVSIAELDRYSYHLTDREAVQHLFGVASGLDSMILGEPQILGQIKQAYRLAKERGATGPFLDRLLQHTLGTAKRVRTETGISRNAVSVAFAAVELAGKIFGALKGRSGLLLGAGKMSDLVARHLITRGVDPVYVASRTYNNAVASAREVGGRAVHWDDGLALLSEASIVVSCTGAPRHVLTKADVSRAMRGRRSGPLFLIDIAVPRDVEPSVNGLDNVYLYDIDGLQGLVDSNLQERQVAARQAKLLIATEVATFDRWRQTQEIAPVIVSLRENLLEMGRNEVTRLRRKFGPMNERQEKAVEHLARSLVQKMLHRPIRHLTQSVDRDDMSDCAAQYREIFGIGARDEQRDEGKQAPSPDGSSRRETPSPSGPQRLLKGGKE